VSGSVADLRIVEVAEDGFDYDIGLLSVDEALNSSVWVDQIWEVCKK